MDGTFEVNESWLKFNIFKFSSFSTELVVSDLSLTGYECADNQHPPIQVWFSYVSCLSAW